MPIRFHCERCQVRMKVPDGSVGARVKCRGCGHIQRVPEESAQASAAEAEAEVTLVEPPALRVPAAPTPTAKPKASRTPKESLAPSPPASDGDDPAIPSSLANLAAAVGGQPPAAETPLEGLSSSFVSIRDDEPAVRNEPAFVVGGATAADVSLGEEASPSGDTLEPSDRREPGAGEPGQEMVQEPAGLVVAMEPPPAKLARKSAAASPIALEAAARPTVARPGEPRGIPLSAAEAPPPVSEERDAGEEAGLVGHEQSEGKHGHEARQQELEASAGLAAAAAPAIEGGRLRAMRIPEYPLVLATAMFLRLVALLVIGGAVYVAIKIPAQLIEWRVGALVFGLALTGLLAAAAEVLPVVRDIARNSFRH